MSSATPVSDLLYRWEAARRDGRPLSPEELCRDCPERLDDLKRQIEVLDQIRPLLADAAPATATGSQAPPASEVAPAPPPGGAAGRYRPVRPHAKGGLGEVLLADDEELNRPVALKRIREDCAYNPTYRRRFLREAEVTARLQHPGVVPVYGLAFDDRGRPC